MIVRILSEGQWELGDDAVRNLNPLDDEVEAAVAAGDQAQLAEALHSLLEQVRSTGTSVADDALVDSDLILPDLLGVRVEVARRVVGGARRQVLDDPVDLFLGHVGQLDERAPARAVRGGTGAARAWPRG